MTVVLTILQQATWAAVSGRIAGTITDPSGAAIPGAHITVTNTAQGIKTKAAANTKGDYSFPSLPAATYDILFSAKGFRSEKRTGLIIDANAAVHIQRARHSRFGVSPVILWIWRLKLRPRASSEHDAHRGQDAAIPAGDMWSKPLRLGLCKRR